MELFTSQLDMERERKRGSAVVVGFSLKVPPKICIHHGRLSVGGIYSQHERRRERENVRYDPGQGLDLFYDTKGFILLCGYNITRAEALWLITFRLSGNAMIDTPFFYILRQRFLLILGWGSSVFKQEVVCVLISTSGTGLFDLIIICSRLKG